MILGFLQWLALREQFNPLAYDRLFDRELETVLPRLADPALRSRLAGMGWTNYIAASLRNAGFREQGQLEELIHDVVVKLLVTPGGLFRDYDERRHGPLDLRFKASVGNAVRNIVAKERTRRRLLPGGVTADDLPSPEAPASERVIDDFRRLVRQRLGQLGLAIMDARLQGEEMKALAEMPELGNPGKNRVKQVVQQIKALAREYAERLGDPAFQREIHRAMGREAATVQRRLATTAARVAG